MTEKLNGEFVICHMCHSEYLSFQIAPIYKPSHSQKTRKLTACHKRRPYLQAILNVTNLLIVAKKN